MKIKLSIALSSLFFAMNIALANQTIVINDNSNSSLLSSNNIDSISYYISTQASGQPLDNIRIYCGKPGGQFIIPIPSDAALNTNYYIVAWNCTSGSANTLNTYDNSVMFTLQNHTHNFNATCGLQNYNGVKLVCSTPPQ